MSRLLAVLTAAALFAIPGDGTHAAPADTQARLAAARPVPTQAAPPPPPPVTAAQPTVRPGGVTAPPKPNLAAPQRPAPKPAPRQDQGLILLAPSLIALVALVRWFARRRRSASERV